MKNQIFYPAIVSCVLLFLGGCGFDHGIAPLPGTLKATVIFRNDPPVDTQGIYLSVAPDFPPRAINQMYHSPNSLPLDQDTVLAEMALPYGRYEAVTLWWYRRGSESNFADILTIPLDISQNLAPRSFTLSKAEPVFEINMYANWDTVKRDAAVSGTIRFDGPFPANTQATAIAAYTYKPELDIHYLVWLKSIDFSIGPESVRYSSRNLTYEYTLPVRHGSIDYLAVFWLPEQAAMTDFTVLGVYPGSISLSAGEEASGCDIEAHWPPDRRQED